MFQGALSDSEQNIPCSSSKGIDINSVEEDIDVPETYDWRLKFAHCVQPVGSIASKNPYDSNSNCTASYAFAAVGAFEDRFCMASSKQV